MSHPDAPLSAPPYPSTRVLQPRFSGVFLLTTALAFAAGVVGALVGTVFFGTFSPTDGDTLALLRYRRDAAQSDVSWEAVNETMRASVSFVLTSAVPEVPMPIGADAVVASGAVLTADGWLVTVRGALPEKVLARPGDLSAVIGERVYKVVSIAPDPYSGVVFVKVEARDLPVVDFAYEVTQEAGDVVLVPSIDRVGIERVAFTGLSLRQQVSAADAVRSSESLGLVLRLGTEVAPGSMLVSRDGRVIGLASAVDAYGVPFAAISKEVSGVLRDMRVTRPFLGVFTVALDHAVSEEDVVLRGARITAGADGVAVRKRSPAEVAGLRAGDIVASVNGEAVTSRRPLADILSEYEPGDTVVLGLQRDGKSSEATVTLGESPVR